jgi:hypothetical protein
MSDFNPLVKDTAELTLDQMLLYSCTAPSPASLAVKSSTPYIMFSTSLDKMSDVDDDSQAYLILVRHKQLIYEILSTAYKQKRFIYQLTSSKQRIVGKALHRHPRQASPVLFRWL